MKVVGRKLFSWKGGGGERRGNENRDLFLPEKGGKSSGLLLGEEHLHCSFPNCRDACVRACETRSLRPGVKQISFLSGVFWGGRDEWEITKERETQLGINEISGDGH